MRKLEEFVVFVELSRHDSKSRREEKLDQPESTSNYFAADWNPCGVENRAQLRDTRCDRLGTLGGGINWNADSTSARVIATIFLGWREGRERETERKGNRVENIERFSMEMVLILFERMKIDERRSKPSSSRLIIHLSHRLSR